MKRRAQAGHRQVDVDPPLEPGPGHGVAEPAERLAAEQGLEPASMEADRHDDQVIGDALALVTVLDGDDDLLVTRVDRYRPGRRELSEAEVQSPGSEYQRFSSWLSPRE